MAKFTDLVFRVHPVLPDATHAYYEFPNGYGLSAATGKYAYTSQRQPYEVAVMLHGVYCADTPITNDVLGHQTPDGITEIMARIEALPKTQEE